MDHRVCACILNYNMPEATEALANAVWNQEGVKGLSLRVLDNGSDLIFPARCTTDYIEKNVQTTNGWLHFLRMSEDYGYEYVWLLITSVVINSEHTQILAPMVDFMNHNPNAVVIHPALTSWSTTSWEHLKSRGGNQPRQTWMVDNIAPLYRMSWLKDHLFDPELIYAWGIDLETCYKARKEDRGIWVHEASKVTKITDIGYSMDRMQMTAQERRILAHKNMEEILSKRYGPLWWSMMLEAYVKEEWR